MGFLSKNHRIIHWVNIQEVLNQYNIEQQMEIYDLFHEAFSLRVVKQIKVFNFHT